MSSNNNNNTTMRPRLRFAVGTRVMARLREIQFFPGTIVKHWVQDPNRPEPFPYLIELDKDFEGNNTESNGNLRMAFAPEDCNTCVKLPPPPGSIYFDQGFVADSFCKAYEPIKGVPYLYTGKAPELGLRVEISFRGPYYNCRVSGILTAVDSEPPTFDQWVFSSSVAPKTGCGVCNPAPTGPDPYACMTADTVLDYSGFAGCPDPTCTKCVVLNGRDKITLGELKDGTERLFGAAHGHNAVAFGYLNVPYLYNPQLPLQHGRIYKMNLQVDDDKVNVWTAQSLEDVSHWPAADLPQVFRNWDFGREKANVAPFDVPPAHLQGWYVQAENVADRSADNVEKKP